MLSNENISSGDQYADLLIETIRISHTVCSGSDRVDDEVVDKWCENIREACLSKYADYISGEVEDYRLEEKEVMDLYDKAVSDITAELLASLVEKGDVKMAIREDGEIVYSATEKGKKRYLKADKKKK